MEVAFSVGIGFERAVVIVSLVMSIMGVYGGTVAGVFSYIAQCNAVQCTISSYYVYGLCHISILLSQCIKHSFLFNAPLKRIF